MKTKAKTKTKNEEAFGKNTDDARAARNENNTAEDITDTKNKNKKIIGLSGRSGSGKGYIAKLICSLGITHIDTDAVYHDLLSPRGGKMSECAAELYRAFGKEIFDGDAVNRKRLAAIVFSDREKLSTLNEITHRYILSETLRLVSESDTSAVLIDAPVLFESGFDKYCDFTLGVVADDETCISRIMKRDGISRDKAALRLSNQLSCEEIESRCDFTVTNGEFADKEELLSELKNILCKMGITLQ